jgi:putative glutamine amidotransferase
MKPLIGITSNYQQKKYKLNSDYITSVLRAGGVPVVICPAANGTSDNKKSLQKNGKKLPTLDKNDYISSIADLLDGLLLSGGNDINPTYYDEKVSVPQKCLKIIPKLRVEFELRLLNEMLKRGKPVLGICFGMQLLNVAFGGSLYQDLSYQSASALNHKETEHNINILQLPELEINCSSYIVNSTHHQAVKKLGKGLEIFALSDDNHIEGFFKKDYPFLMGIQWHPERMPDNELSLKILKLFIKKAQQIKNEKTDINRF